MSKHKGISEQIDLMHQAMREEIAKKIFKDLDNLPDVEAEEPSGCDLSGLVVFNIEDYDKLKKKYGVKK